MTTTYKRRRDAGMCVRCEVPTQGQARCPGCARIVSVKRRTKRQLQRADGICVECQAVSPNRYRCIDCARHRTEAARAGNVRRSKCGYCHQLGHNISTCEDAERDRMQQEADWTMERP